jgi:hypothetical protein
MPAATLKSLDAMSEPARIARTQWRKDCFRRESRRADELFLARRDMYAVARAYLAADRRRTDTLARVQAEILAGDFVFFIGQGVPQEVLDRPLAELLLHDWDNGMVSNLAAVEERFELRFHHDLGEFLAIPAHALAILLTPDIDPPSDAQVVPRPGEPSPSNGHHVGVCA